MKKEKRMNVSGKVFLCLMVLSFFSHGALAGPLTFNSALPLPQEQRVIRQVGMALFKERNTRKLSVFSSTTVLALSQTEKSALFLIVPYLRKELKAGAIKRRASGFSDIRVFERFTVSIRNLHGRTVRSAFFLGFKAPTGNWKSKDAFGELPRKLQPGSGSWSSIFGLAFSDQAFAREWDFALQGDLNGKGGGYQFGSSVRLDASLQKRIWPGELTGGVPNFLYGILEVNVVKSFKDKSHGKPVDGTGGLDLHFVPGLQLVSKRYVVEGGVVLPILQDLPEGALKDKVGLVLGLRYNF